MELSSSIKAGITISFLLYSLILVIGTVYSGRMMAKTSINKYLDEFYTAGRGLGTLVIAFLISASICSSSSFIGAPGVLYSFGLTWGIMFPMFTFANLNVLGTVGKKLAIISRRISIQSYIGVLYERYNKNRAILIVSVVSILIFLTSYAASQLIGGARILEVITGIPYIWALVLFGGVVILYSAFGGLRGISIVVVFQGIIMTIGALLLFIFALKAIGMSNGFYALEKANPQLVKVTGFPLRYQLSLWVAFGLVYIAYPHGALGAMVYKNSKSMHKSIVVGAIVVAIWSLCIQIPAILARAVIPNISVPDHVIPLLSAKILPPWLAGVVMAGAGAAAQTTIATMLIVMSAAVVKDFYLIVVNPKISEKFIKRFIFYVTGAIGIVLFILASFPPKMLTFIVIYAVGGLSATFFWPFLLGLYWMRATEWGALGSMISGIVSYILLKTFIKPLAFGMDPIIMSMLVSLVFMIVLSLSSKKTPKHIIEIFWGE
ncbi:MAG: sodium/pantothenate symporter [Atribacterota bacterium]|nr:sodium/pantothenate symporter [Atribacterota bacterium]